MEVHGVIYSVDNGVALIGCNNGPVNSLGLNLRKGLVAGMNMALSDDNVQAIVIYGEGRTFPAGADISEFATGTVGIEPLPPIYVMIEDSPKPVVAACHGTCLGGGLELAMSCHYRIGTGSSQYGFPEVNLGLLPGAGGTQRAPRLVGPLVALEMCSTGKNVNAWKAEQVKLLDAVVEVPRGESTVSYLKQQGVYFALSIAGQSLDGRRTRLQECEPLDDFYFDNAKMMAAKAARGHIAPAMNVDCVKAAASGMPIDKGFELEQKSFFKLVKSPESKALQHVFYASRAVTKVPGVNMKSALPVRKVGIIGAGTMGGGIAMCFAQKGIQVVLKDIKQEYLNRGMKVIKGNWKRSAKKGKWTAYQVKSMTGLIQPTLDYADLADCDMIIEAVFENMELKKKIFRTLNDVCKPECILATNTSTLDIDEIAAVVDRPDKVIGMHFFSPANVMRLLENIRAKYSSESTIATATKYGKLIGKTPVLVGNCFGFVGNRCIFPYSAQAEQLILEGSSPYDVDKALYKFGMAMGPIQMADLSGVDVGVKIRKEQMKKLNITKRPAFFPHDVTDLLAKDGNYGQKTKQGWYDYRKSRRGKPREATLALVEEVRARNGVTPRKHTVQEIQERCVYALINEGFKCLEDGIANHPQDVDVIFMFGYGFPVPKGGPMHYADRVGLRKIAARIEEFHQQNPVDPSWEISPLLKQCAERRVGIYKHYKKLQKRKAKL